MLHEKTKVKIKKLFEMADTYCDLQLEKLSDYPDALFIIDAFSTMFRESSFKLRAKSGYTCEDYHNDIFEFDLIISSWSNNLVHFLPQASDTNNDLYIVLFSLLQAAETICDEDHFAWEEDEIDTEEDEDKTYDFDINPGISLTSDDEEDNYIEREF